MCRHVAPPKSIQSRFCKANSDALRLESIENKTRGRLLVYTSFLVLAPQTTILLGALMLFACSPS